MFRKKSYIEKQKKYFKKSISDLQFYIKSRNYTYSRQYSVSEFERYKYRFFYELRNLYGEQNSYITHITSLKLEQDTDGNIHKNVLENSFGALLGIVEGAFSELEILNNYKKYQVFISSTYKDLVNYRAAAYDVVTAAGYFPAGMENFIATSSNPVKYIKHVIDETDYYVLLVGQRYGTFVENSDISFTEMEYEYAKSKKLNIIPLIYDGDDILKCSDKNEKFNAFVRKIKRENTVMYFSDIKDLKVKINQALTEAIKNHPMPGWIKLNKNY